jgi:glycerophosphoryl diester phosphodiesterase
MHDPTVDRTTNGSGDVARLTLKQLRVFDAGYRFGPMTYPYRDRGITIPTVAEALDSTVPLPLIIEIKSIEAAEPLLALIRGRHEEERVTIGSFISGALVPFRRAGIATTASFDEVRALLVPAVCRLRRANLPFSMMSIPPTYRGLPLPVGALVRCMAAAGGSVYLWTVNDASAAVRFWQRGVRGILSDDPGAMIEARGRIG